MNTSPGLLLYRIFIFFQFILSQQQVYEDDLKPGSNENGYASYEDEDEA